MNSATFMTYLISWVIQSIKVSPRSHVKRLTILFHYWVNLIVERFIGKTGIEHAFCIIPIHRSCYHLFDFTWTLHILLWPLSSCAESCRIFEHMFCALQWFLQLCGKVAESHVLADFIFIVLRIPIVITGFHSIHGSGSRTVYSINQEKTFPPLLSIQYMISNWIPRLPADKLHKLKDTIGDMRKRHSVTLLCFQRAIGLFSWASRVISPCRCFLRRLINLSIGICRPNPHIRLNADARADCVTLFSLFFQWDHNIHWFYLDSTIFHSHYSEAASTQGFAAVLGALV